jgi:hypothetical protein
MSDDTPTDIEKQKEEAREEIERLEEDPPEKLEDWPAGKAKYETFGGPEGEHSYDEGPEQNLGPDSVRHHEDGSVTVAGEEADDRTGTRASRSPAGRPIRTSRGQTPPPGVRGLTPPPEE